MTPTEREALEKAALAATAGPWFLPDTAVLSLIRAIIAAVKKERENG